METFTCYTGCRTAVTPRSLPAVTPRTFVPLKKCPGQYLPLIPCTAKMAGLRSGGEKSAGVVHASCVLSREESEEIRWRIKFKWNPVLHIEPGSRIGSEINDLFLTRIVNNWTKAWTETLKVSQQWEKVHWTKYNVAFQVGGKCLLLWAIVRSPAVRLVERY